MGVRKPAAYRHSMLWMENIRRWRIVDDDGFSQIAANLREVFDIVSLMVVTTLTEKAMMNNMIDIELIQ